MTNAVPVYDPTDNPTNCCPRFKPDGGFLVLSHDDSAWHGEHLFAVSKPVTGAEMVSLSGDFLTKVFEGPFSEARTWADEMKRDLARQGRALDWLSS